MLHNHHLTFIMLAALYHSSHQHHCYMSYGDKVIDLQSVDENFTCGNENKIFKPYDYLHVDFQFVKYKPANKFHFSLALNVSIANDEKQSYSIKLDSGTENITKFINNDPLHQAGPTQFTLEDKSNQDKIIIVQVSQLSTGFKGLYCTQLPFVNQIANQWLPTTVIELTYWMDRIVFVSFKAAPNEYNVLYYNIRLITSDYRIHDEKYRSHEDIGKTRTSKTDFHNLQFGIGYFVVIEAICQSDLQCPKKSESEIFKLPLSQSQLNSAFNQVHTIVFYSVVCILLICCLCVLLVSERRRIQLSKKILIILPAAYDDVYRTTAFVNLLQKCHFKIAVEEWKNVNNDLQKIISNFKFVIIFCTKANEDIISQCNNQHLSDLIQPKKFLNVFWDDSKPISNECHSNSSFTLPKEIHKLLCYLNDNTKKKLKIEFLYEFYDTIKMGNEIVSDATFSSDFIETDFESTYYDYDNYQPNSCDSVNSRKILLPVYHEKSSNNNINGNNYSSVLLHSH